MSNIHDLFKLEQFSRDSFRVKRTYIDICGDLVAGILLGQIVYWFMPNEHGKSKLRVWKDGELWLAKGRNDWWDEIRITAKQFDRAIKILEYKGFIETKKFKFNGAPTVHIKLNVEKVTEAVNSILTVGEDGFLPKGKIQITETGKTLTEITTEITTNNKSLSIDEQEFFEETEMDKVSIEYQQKIGQINGDIAIQLEHWRNELGDELVKKAIDIAYEQGKRRWSYIRGILKNFKEDGITSLTNLEAQEKKKSAPRRPDKMVEAYRKYIEQLKEDAE